jgi:RHS repeat-associated protein
LTGGVDEVFNRTTTGGDRSLLTDALGSTIAGADSHSIGVEYTYEPFGATTVTGDDLGNPTRFTGREDDPSGLYYYRSRFYSPSTGRFISQDPLGLGSGDTNPYAYVFNQPTSLVDPMGTKPQGSGDCLSNSFVAGTPVLMADGSRKPIEQVEPGDKVMATDPESGQSGARPVTAVIKGDGAKTLVEVSVRGQDGGERSLTATDGHPFWVDEDGRAETPGGRWIDAVELQRGQWLKTADGDLVQVAGTHAHRQHAVVYNLTVADLHTYHVIAGDTSVLVHNCGEDARFAVGGDEVATDRAGARFVVGEDGTVTDTVGGSNAVSLGRYPDYLLNAQRTGSNTFNVGDAWEGMVARTDRFGGDGPGSEIWIRNSRFLDQAIARGSLFRLASNPLDPANAESFFMREIRYLQSKGYTIGPGYMIPPA